MTSSSFDLNIVIEQPDKAEASRSSSEYRPRRSHQKSRAGCANCKHRRIKCDEVFPTCGRCSEKELQCHYLSTTSQEDNLSTAQITSTSITTEIDQAAWTGTVTTDAYKLQVLSLMSDAANGLGPSQPIQSSWIGDGFELVDFFVRTTNTTWIGSPTCQIILQAQGIETAMESPWLLHTFSAFSAEYLHQKFPLNETYKISAAVHYSNALALYRQYLNRAPNCTNRKLKLLSIFLHAMLAFLHAETEPSDSSDEQLNLGWISSIQAIRLLLNEACASVLRQSFPLWHSLQEVYMNVPDSQDSLIPEMGPDAEVLHHLLFICDAASDGLDNPYAVPLAKLSHLLRQRPDVDGVDDFLSFVTILPSAFTMLLNEKEPKALLVLGMWYTMFGRIDQWWIPITAKKECWNVCNYVSQTDDRKFQQPLIFLSQWCGYPLLESEPGN